MVASTYPEAIRRLLLHEGGYTNHPKDPGGPTNFGITIFDYRKYIKAGGTAEDVRRMNVEEAKAIYKSKYWDVGRGDQLNPGVDYSVFDYGVNSGTGRSGKVLRRCCGMDASTSVVTAEVVAAANKRDPVVLADAINDERLHFLQNLKTWSTFGPGWGRRVKEVRVFSEALATKKAKTAALPAPGVQPIPGKGEIPKPPTKTIGGVATVGTAAAGGGFWEWVSANPWTTGALVAAVLAAVVSIIVALHARRNAKQEEPGFVQIVPELPLAANESVRIVQ